MKKLSFCLVLGTFCGLLFAASTGSVLVSDKAEIEYLTRLILSAKQAGMLPDPEWSVRLNELTLPERSDQLDQANDRCPATLITTCPFTDSGTIIGYTNDYTGSCGNPISADVIYQYTATATGMHTVSMCGSLYDGVLYIRTGGNCPGTTEIACNDDYCGASPQISLNLVSGTTYWFIVDGYWGSQGNYAFSLTCPTGCVPDATINAPGTYGPVSTCGANDDCTFLRPGQDRMVRVNIPFSGFWTFSLCRADTNWDTYMYLTTDCCGGTVIATDDDACPEYGVGYSQIVCQELDAGTYYVDIEPYSHYYCGPVTLTVSQCQPCIVECQPGDVVECYENPADTSFYRTDCNGGCNSTPYLYQTLGCGETVCGDVFTYIGPGGFYRDTDWYRFTLTNSSDVSWTVVAEVAVNLLILDVTDCNNVIHLAEGSASTPCTPATITAHNLGPGTYAAWVGPQVFSGVPPSDYRATLTWECPPPECPTDSILVHLTDYISLPGPIWDVDLWWCLHLNSGQVPSWVCIEAADPSNLPVWGQMIPGCNSLEHCWEPDCQPVLGFRADLPIWVSQPLPHNPNHGWYCTAFWKVPPSEEGCCLCVNLDLILPVELASFSATAGDNRVTLNWTTASESNTDHFEIERDGVVVGRVRAACIASGASYTWVDEATLNGTTYVYELLSADVNGYRKELGTVSASPNMSAAIVSENRLYQNFPNPFNPTTTITFDMVMAGHVTLTLYDLMGREVATVANETMNAGRHMVTFNADHLSSGVYLYRLNVNGFVAEKKMLLLK